MNLRLSSNDEILKINKISLLCGYPSIIKILTKKVLKKKLGQY